MRLGALWYYEYRYNREGPEAGVYWGKDSGKKV